MQEFSISLIRMRTNTPVTISDEFNITNYTYKLL